MNIKEVLEVRKEIADHFGINAVDIKFGEKLPMNWIGEYDEEDGGDHTVIAYTPRNGNTDITYSPLSDITFQCVNDRDEDVEGQELVRVLSGDEAFVAIRKLVPDDDISGYYCYEYYIHKLASYSKYWDKLNTDNIKSWADFLKED